MARHKLSTLLSIPIAVEKQKVPNCSFYIFAKFFHDFFIFDCWSACPAIKLYKHVQV